VLLVRVWVAGKTIENALGLRIPVDAVDTHDARPTLKRVCSKDAALHVLCYVGDETLSSESKTGGRAKT